jgi:hypothetical protein
MRHFVEEVGDSVARVGLEPGQLVTVSVARVGLEPGQLVTVSVVAGGDRLPGEGLLSAGGPSAR